MNADVVKYIHMKVNTQYNESASNIDRIIFIHDYIDFTTYGVWLNTNNKNVRSRCLFVTVDSKELKKYIRNQKLIKIKRL